MCVCVYYKRSVNFVLEFVQLLPQHSHGVLDDGRHRHRAHRLHRENVPVLLLPDFQVVLQLRHVDALRLPRALPTVNAPLLMRHFQVALVHLEHFLRTGTHDRLLVFQRQVDFVVNFDFGVWLEGRQRHGRPFGVHFADSLLDVELEVDLLVLVQLDDGNAEFLALVETGGELDWQYRLLLADFHLHGFEDGSDVERSDFPGFVALVVDLEGEVVFADLAVVDVFLGAVAVPGVLEVVDSLAVEGDESDSLGEELIMEDGGVFDDADEVGGEGGDFGEEDPAEGVGEADVAVVEDELDFVGGEFQDLATDFGHEIIIVEGALPMQFKFIITSAMNHSHQPASIKGLNKNPPFFEEHPSTPINQQSKPLTKKYLRAKANSIKINRNKLPEDFFPRT